MKKTIAILLVAILAVSSVFAAFSGEAKLGFGGNLDSGEWGFIDKSANVNFNIDLATATAEQIADGDVYAVAQGTIATGAVAGNSNTSGSSVVKGVPTAGRIASGAIIEKEIPFALDSLNSINIALRNPDFTTSRRIAGANNAMLGTTAAKALDPGTVELDVPHEYQNNIVGLMTKVEQLQVP